MYFNFAVPAVNWVVATTAESSHRGAEASQKVTDPVATGAPPATTEAVNVTAVGEATDEEERTSVVAEGTAAAWAALGKVTAIRADRSSFVFRPRRGRTQAERWSKFHIQESSVRTYFYLSTLTEREMPTGADSDPKQLLTHSPNFSFRKFSATGETNRIRNRTLHCIPNSAQFSTTLGYTRITLLMWFPQYCAKPVHKHATRSGTVCRLFATYALIIRIAMG
jgi:hypothetical protein